MKHKGTLLGLSAAVSISLTSFSIGAESVCPIQLNGGQVKEAKYQFQFKSWGWPRDGRHVFCHCIRNDHKDLAVYVDWRGTDLSGFVDAQDEIHVYDDYASDAHDEKKMPLFYGLGLKRTEALTMIPTQVRRSDIYSPRRFAQLPETTKSDAPKTDATAIDLVDSKETRTEGKVFIPAFPPSSKANIEEIIRKVESGDLPLVPVLMEFRSSASKAGDKIRLDFTCRYNIAGQTFSGESVATISADPVLKKWFGESLPFAMRSDWRGPRSGQSAAINSVEVTSNTKLVLRHGVMTFNSGSGAVLATIPVKYITPE